MRHVARLPSRAPAYRGSSGRRPVPAAAPCAAPSPWRGLALLRHRHLRGEGPDGIVSYDVAQEMQEHHRSLLLSWKALPQTARQASNSPGPLLVSFESTPIFTLGRRQDDLGPTQAARLQQRLVVSLTRRREPISKSFHPQVQKTNRGGLTTYHGPGQLVLWPVIDMHSPLHARHGVASYAAHLEATTQRLLAELFGIRTATVRDEPGVWVAPSIGSPRKIAALGVHHRRYVTALGIAVNIDMPVTGGEDVNPWARFVPCGLEGKAVTSVAAETGRAHDAPGVWDLAALATRWASMFEEGLVDEKKRGETDARLQRWP